MMIINAQNVLFSELNKKIREADAVCVLENCLGQRFIGSGMSGKEITINGIPGKCPRRISRLRNNHGQRKRPGRSRRHDE